MFERLNTAQDAFKWELGAALTMEREIVEMLDELIEASRGEPVKQAFRSHQAETRGHVANIEDAFRTCGWEVDDSPCPVVHALEKEGKANVKKADEQVVDQIILGGAIETEHHEIAVYEKLIIAARGIGREDVAEVLSRNLGEEQHALQKVSSLARDVALGAPVG
jgi:ferritin-like metal-binding protein YciE